ncbi:uncharacterized protein HD556DRAFT_1347969 [Suillus plorans]|uniref:Hydrophobin n=1 Tax=Suillus plorans TaxID=116603 RepID=A0A9P7J1S3_9AGAM|nr:uncharacterized protein HD556DRAFT_1347969 [Suillus plorans]KAG1799453.1 hypothetical protein HD556DRAFT_1347969 [Suillus plorans]
MHFSFLRVVAVVAALTGSMSVTAQSCASVGQACGKTSPVGLSCCSGLSCTPVVSISRSLCIRNSTPRLTFAPCTNRNELCRLSMSQ